MRYAIYSRKSVFTGKGDSIENQLSLCKAYIKERLGAEDNEILIYEDEGFSGGNTKRPMFKAMQRDIDKGAFDILICYRLDRISRNVSDFSALIEQLNRKGVGFICIKEEFDTQKPMGKAMMYIASVFAQLERETIAERVKDNMLMLAKNGQWLGGSPPFGYRSIKESYLDQEGRMRFFYTLKEDPLEIGAAKEIFKLYLSTGSVLETSRALLMLGIRNRSNESFKTAALKDILLNPVYCAADISAFSYFKELGAEAEADIFKADAKNGMLAYNKRSGKKSGSYRNNIDCWVIAAGRHEAAVSGTKWVDINRRLKINGKGQRQKRNSYALLSGIIYCSCGERMRSKLRHNGAYDYICEKKLRNNSLCTCPNLNGRKADEKMMAALYEMLSLNEESYYYILRKKLSEIISPHNNVAAERPAELEREIKGLFEIINNASQDEEALIKEAKKRIGVLSGLRDEIIKNSDLKEDNNLIDDYFLKEGKSSILSLELTDKRKLLSAAYNRLVWDGKALMVYYND